MALSQQPPSHPPPSRLPPSPSSTASTSSTHTSPRFCLCFPPTKKPHLLFLLRILILLLALSSLTLDITTIAFIYTHKRDLPHHFFSLSPSSFLRVEAFIPLVLGPDIAAVVLMMILLWKPSRMRFSDRWWRAHVAVRVVVGLLLVGVGAVEPALEAAYYERGDRGWKEYFCIEPKPFWRGSNRNDGGWSLVGFRGSPRNSTYASDSSNHDADNVNNGTTNNNSNNSTGTSVSDGWQTGSNSNVDYYRSTNIQECKVLRSRSILTFIWLLLLLLELMLAYFIGEFRSPSRRTKRGRRLGRGRDSLGSAVGESVCVGGDGGAKRPVSTISSEPWDENQQQQQQQSNEHTHYHYHHHQDYSNNRSLDRVEEIDEEEEYDFEKEDEGGHSSATSTRRASSSSGTFTLQKWSAYLHDINSGVGVVPTQEIGATTTANEIVTTPSKHISDI